MLFFDYQIKVMSQLAMHFAITIADRQWLEGTMPHLIPNMS